MPTGTKSRYGLYIGLTKVSFVKIEQPPSGQWQVSGSGQFCLDTPEGGSAQEDQLRTALPKLARDGTLNREPAHVSLHNRFCITRVVTGDRDHVEDQFVEIEQNSQHYLQQGLGEKLIGTSCTRVDDSHWYGQVAVIKRGLIEAIDAATRDAGLELSSAECALSSISRLAGFAGLDDSPLLIVWLGTGGAELGISYQGRLQLNYHAGASETAESTLETIRKHLKRLRRFCERYRQVSNASDLRRVFVLGGPAQAGRLKEQLEQLDFDHVYTLDDLSATPLAGHISLHKVDSPGKAAALGGLLVQLESDVVPMTDLFEKYVDSKPRPLLTVLWQDGWHTLVTAIALLAVWLGGWSLEVHSLGLDDQVAALSVGVHERHARMVGLSEQRELLTEYRRLEASLEQTPTEQLLMSLAKCLPDDTRIELLALDDGGRLVIKGTMLHGDSTYELLKSLSRLPSIKDVALESVGRASNFGQNATLFEIHCELVDAKATTATDALAAKRNGSLPR